MIEYYSHNKLEDWKTSFHLKLECKVSANRSEYKVFKLFYGYHSFIFLFFTNFAPSILT